MTTIVRRKRVLPVCFIERRALVERYPIALDEGRTHEAALEDALTFAAFTRSHVLGDSACSCAGCSETTSAHGVPVREVVSNMVPSQRRPRLLRKLGAL